MSLMDDYASPGAGIRVGDLASSAGLTVRTLHYFDEIGLLHASQRSAAGHRLYSDADVERLYRICLLRRLGLPLDAVGQALNDPAWNLHAVLSTHLHDVERRLETGARLRGMLTRLLAATTVQATLTADDLLNVLEEMTMLDNQVRKRISILVYGDLDAAFTYLTDVFGFGPGEITRDPNGNAVHGEIEVGDGVVWLHPESAEFMLSSPHSLGATTSTMAVMVDDVDAHYRRTKDAGATIIYLPVDQPYGYREYSARDCEGGLWSFMKPLES